MTRNILAFGLVLSGCVPASGPSLPDGKNRVVDIVNTTDFPLQFSAINAERQRFIPQKSTSGDVAANYYLTLNLDDGSGACFFDFTAVLADGTRVKAERFNACFEASWVVRP